jgi:multiple sugar transport system permease protein
MTLTTSRALPAARVAIRGRALELAKNAAFYALLSFLAVIFVFPFVWALLTSLKSNQEVFQAGVWLPSVWRFDNYLRAVQAVNLPRHFLNSLIVALTVTAAHLVLASTAGYAFARLRFPARDALFALVIATLMVPSQATLVPLFILVKHWPLLGDNDLWGQGGFGMLDTYWVLTVPMFATAYGTFLLRQFFLGLPVELEDAARIDGSSELGIYWRIVLPLSGPAMATLGIFSFQNVWNDFVWPLVTTRSDAMKTIQVGLAQFRREGTTEWTLLMAGNAMSLVPMLVLFFIGQRFFVQGISLTGMR